MNEMVKRESRRREHVVHTKTAVYGNCGVVCRTRMNVVPKKLRISAEVLTTNLSGKRVKLLIHCNQPPLCATELRRGRMRGGVEEEEMKGRESRERRGGRGG